MIVKGGQGLDMCSGVKWEELVLELVNRSTPVRIERQFIHFISLCWIREEPTNTHQQPREEGQCPW